MVSPSSSILLLGTIASLLFSGARREDAQRLVRDAAHLMEQVGVDSAAKVISDTTGPFVDGDLYVFVYDFEGIIVAHSRNPKLIGKSVLTVPDVDGKLFRKEIIRVAKTTGSGWVDYRYRNPVTNRMERKSTWVLRVGDLVVCCGVYL